MMVDGAIPANDTIDKQRYSFFPSENRAESFPTQGFRSLCRCPSINLDEAVN